MYLIYNVLGIIIVAALIPVILFRLQEQGFIERVRQSFGFVPKEVLDKVAEKDCIWLHAASVGEIVATSPIVKEIRKEFPDRTILVSVVTTTGYEMAKRIIPEAQAIMYFPLDLPGLPDSVLKKIKPRVFMPVETELWPNFLAAARSMGVLVMMVNGRISDKSAVRYHYLRGILKDMVNSVHRFCMQSKLDAEYIINLGADPERVTVTGNTKFDQTYTYISPEEKKVLAEELTAHCHHPVFLAGSTHKGEEEIILKVAGELKTRYPKMLTMIAPRDIQRTDEIMKIAKSYGLTCRRRTELRDNAALRQESYDVIILDTIGELGKAYSLGDIIFVGGSLVALGGHNVLEPAAHGKPIIVGPHMFNFKESYALFTKRGACATAHNDEELKNIIENMLNNHRYREKMAEASLAIINENQGAAKKSVEYLKQLLKIC